MFCLDADALHPGKTFLSIKEDSIKKDWPLNFAYKKEKDTLEASFSENHE